MSRDSLKRDERISLSALIIEVIRERAADPSVLPLAVGRRVLSWGECKLHRSQRTGKEGR
jgi:hypothetical protein